MYARARSEGYLLTAHCDVDQQDSVKHIWQCVDLLGVDRIDHGINSIEDKHLVAQLRERRIALTACPTQRSTDPQPQDLDRIRALFEADVCISLNTDDPAQFDSGYPANLLCNVQRADSYSTATMIRFARNGFEGSFLAESDKSAYSESLTEYAGRN